MRTLGVVGTENLANEQEEVVEPAGAQGRLDRRRTIAFAQVMIQNMRMRDILAILRARWLLGMNAVWMRSLADLPPWKHDAERSQIDSFELD